MMIKKLFLIICLLALPLSVFGQGKTLQYIIGGSSDSPANDGTTEYAGLMGEGNALWAVEIERTQIIPTSGKLSDFKVGVVTAPGAGKSWTFTIRKNGADTSLSASIAGTAVLTSLDTDEVAVSPGDTVCISATGTGTPAATPVHWTVKFTPDTAGETILMCSNQNWATSVPRYVTLIGNKTIDLGRFDGQTLFPTSGTLKSFYCVINTAPGAGTSRTFKIEKNGTDSDIAITIAETDTTGNDVVNSLVIAAGDQLTIKFTGVTGAPASTIAHFGIVFVPNTPNEWFTSATTDDDLNTSQTEFQHLTCGDSTLGNTPGPAYTLAQATTAKAIYVALSLDPGISPDAYSFTLRRNAETDTNLTVTITANDKTGNYAEDVDISADDLLTTKITPLNTPSATPASQIAYLFYNSPSNNTINNATLNNCVIR